MTHKWFKVVTVTSIVNYPDRSPLKTGGTVCSVCADLPNTFLVSVFIYCCKASEQHSYDLLCIIIIIIIIIINCFLIILFY
jgi:hypothetical protein